MAYSFTNKRIWGVDATGIVTHRPVWLRSAVFYPDAIGDSVTFKSWHPQGELGTTEHAVLDNYANPPLDAKCLKGGQTLYAPKNESYRQTVSISGGNTITDPGGAGTFFTAAKVGTPPSIMRILYSEDATNYRETAGPGAGGLGGNLLIETRTDDNNIVVAEGAGSLSNETSKIYSWWIITDTTYIDTAFVIKALKTSGSDTIVQGAVMYDFGERGKWFPNLACTALSTSASVDLYLK